MLIVYAIELVSGAMVSSNFFSLKYSIIPDIQGIRKPIIKLNNNISTPKVIFHILCKVIKYNTEEKNNFY
ncbi:hypothetical protein KQI86_02695 [Clostridium sp. MSJ-11]|uniref:Uncharacterized protein n=1 Tax=Clostridium mobile TaxID=2841512 RepID=A0ABS6EFP1_9CLOT|nr:hypothetical protein [Clostridium mobile]MBU5483219.1 hypothetical protein [Clostridium mobile]